MSFDGLINSIFYKTRSDVRLKLNYSESIKLYSKITGRANFALGKSYKVS